MSESALLPASSPKNPHTHFEDAIALLTSTLVISFGLLLLRQTGAVSGGIAGVAFLAHYATGIRFGLAFFLLNAPFYYFAYKRMGLAFVCKTIAAVAMVSAFAELHPLFIDVGVVNLWYSTIFGNLLIGIGLLMLFRHRASLGGVNILALYLQDRNRISAGKFQMAVDLTIIAAAMALVPFGVLLASLAGGVVLNMVIAMNHKPFRYLS